MLSWTACCFPARGRCELLQCDVDEDGVKLRWSWRDRRVFISKFTIRRKASASSVAEALSRSKLEYPNPLSDLLSQPQVHKAVQDFAPGT